MCINQLRRRRQISILTQTAHLSHNRDVTGQQSPTVASTPKRFVYSEPKPENAVSKDNVLTPNFPFDTKSQLSLLEELPNLPKLKSANQLQAPITQISTLNSGLRVISQETYGQAATIGLFVNAGSRHEDEYTLGVSHMLEHLGFKTTKKRSHSELLREIETIGALTTASSGREQIIYTIDLLRDNLDKGVELLADAILNINPTSDEIQSIKMIMGYQNQEMQQNAPGLVQEAIHAAAYGPKSSLGRPVHCVDELIDSLTIEKVKAFQERHFVPSKMVLAGSGIEHEKLVELGEKYFKFKADSINISTHDEIQQPVYLGQLEAISKPDSTFSYAALAFPTGGWHNEDLVPVCVLHTLLGGGDSFSAGGPGKGMYSRLYTSVLNRFHWVESAFAFSSIHNDVGLMGIYGAATPSHTSNLVAVLCNQLLHVAQIAVDPLELSRAKNQLKSSVLMNLESRMILYEDIGRQLLTYGYRESPQSVCAKIDKVTTDDIQRVMRTAMTERPSMVYYGDLKLFPAYDQVFSGIKEGLRQV
ncbi:unnamed protein product [Albugo candida]|nr:unnamed protein product [Albugo candida]|eukprot:CCI40389.1 unnamed protein product [Albugo candida]